jgi:ABC-type branched-subunit amino acid transport system substrate-binding protein
MISRSTHLVYTLSLIITLIVVLVGCNGVAKTNANPREIRIGAIASLNGPAGEQGRNWVQGAELAVQELGKEGITVKLIVDDDSTQAAKAVSAFQRMVAIEKVDAVIGGTWDFLAEALYPLARKYETPFLTLTNPVEIISAENKDNPWILTNSFSLASERVVVREFLKKEQIHSVALVGPNVPFGAIQVAMFRDLARELNIPVVFEYEFDIVGASDTIKNTALRIKQNPPDLVFIVHDYNGLAIFTEQLHLLEISPKILTVQHLDEAFALSKSPELYRNCFGIYSDVKNPAFTKLFTEHYRQLPKVYAAEGFDGVQFLTRALLKGGKGIYVDREAAFTYEGILGQYRLPSGGREVGNSTAVIMTTRNGVFKKWE